MTPTQEAQLLTWYQENSRELPWRQTRELYPVLVSELMLQQTTVAAVTPLFRRWMDRFPSLAALAQATPDSVMEAWSGLGYYSRAKRLHQTAKLLSERDCLPSSLEELLELPGLGPYTAAAVASIALGLPHLALDTNALRVLLRLYGWEVRSDQSSVAETLRRRVEGALPGSDFGVTNQAIMELGATICKVRAPACIACPLARECQARALAIEERIPVPKPRKAAKVTPVSAYIISGDGTAVLLVRGMSIGLLGDLFQPPLDFYQENPPGSALTPLLEWLRQRSQPAPAVGLTYGISGRRLEIGVKEIEGAATALELMDRAADWGVEARFFKAGDAVALSSLTRKILSVWEGSREAPRAPDEKC